MKLFSYLQLVLHEYWDMIEQDQRSIPPQQSLTAFIPSYFTEISREV